MTAHKMVLIPTSGEVIVKEVNDGLDALYAALNCEAVEAISGVLHGHMVSLFFDEDGKETNAPHNSFATKIGLTFGMYPFDYIAGDVLVLAVGPEGDTVDLPDDVISKLCEPA